MQAPPVAPSSALPAPEPWTAPGYVPMFAPPPPRGALRFMGIPIGILLIVGMASLQAAVLLPRPNPFFGPPDPATQAYLDTVRLLSGVAFGAMDTAVALTVMFTWHAAIARPDLPEASRRGLLTFCAIFLGVWLLITTFSLFTFSVLILSR